MFSFHDDCAEVLLRVRTIIVNTFGYFCGAVYAFIRFILLCRSPGLPGVVKIETTRRGVKVDVSFLVSDRVWIIRVKNRQFFPIRTTHREKKNLNRCKLRTGRCGPNRELSTADIFTQQYDRICFIAFIY